jgi:hypothetical protein
MRKARACARSFARSSCCLCLAIAIVAFGWLAFIYESVERGWLPSKHKNLADVCAWVFGSLGVPACLVFGICGLVQCMQDPHTRQEVGSFLLFFLLACVGVTCLAWLQVQFVQLPFVASHMHLLTAESQPAGQAILLSFWEAGVCWLCVLCLMWTVEVSKDTAAQIERDMQKDEV